MNKKSSLLTAALIMALVALYYFGVLGYVYSHDTLYLSTAIAATSVFAYGHGLRHPLHSGKWAEVVVGMGLLGTVIGFSSGLAAVEESGQGADALYGAFIAFHTTAVGLVGALVLRVQYWFADGEL